MPKSPTKNQKLCFECDAIAEHDHHVIPRSRGGKKTVPLCVRCHSKAHGKKMAHNSLTKDALLAKKLRGERTGSVPFGYKLSADGVRLEPQRDQLEAAKLMKLMRRNGFTLREIALQMTAMGVLTAKGNFQWSHSSVQSVLGLRKQ